MIRLRKRRGTPLVNGMYVVYKGLYQIRLKDTQEIISAVESFSRLVEVGRLLIKRYGTVERIRRLLSQCEYNTQVPEQELVKRKCEELVAVNKDLNKDWHREIVNIK